MMNREEIAIRAKGLRCMEDLLQLINDVKADRYGNTAFPFTPRQLSILCNPDRTTASYTSFSIRKRNGGTRTISVPSHMLKNLQGCISTILQSLYDPSPAACGFVEGRSIVDNASMHTGKSYVLNLDLKDFFPSISQARVWGTLKSRSYGIHPRIAGIIAGICCKRNDNADGTVCYVLPQGSPASPVITNMVCTNLDRRLIGLAKRFGCWYSRYADDISFSSDRYMYSERGPFMSELRRIIAGQGFTINEAKTRLQKRGDRQEVTGLTVSEKVNVPREYVRGIDNLLFIWERYGPEDAAMKMHQYPGRRLEHGKNLETVVKGRIEWVGQIKGRDSRLYLRFMERYDLLMKGDLPVDICEQKSDLLSCCSLGRFEKIIGGAVMFRRKPDDSCFKDRRSSYIGYYRNPSSIHEEKGRYSVLYIGRHIYKFVDKVLRNNSMTIPEEFKSSLVVAHIRNRMGCFRVLLGKESSLKGSSQYVEEHLEMARLSLAAEFQDLGPF